MNTFKIALEVSVIGLGGVFLTLILFYLVTKAMILIAQKLPEQSDD